MIKLRSPQIRISFQRAADKTALLAFALGLALSLAVPGAGAKDREEEDTRPRALPESTRSAEYIRPSFGFHRRQAFRGLILAQQSLR